MGARIKTERQIKGGQDKKIARKKKETHSKLCCLLWKKKKKRRKSPWLYWPVKQICLTHVNEFGRDFLVKQPQVRLQINYWIEQINPKPSLSRLHTHCSTQGILTFQLATARPSWQASLTPRTSKGTGKTLKMNPQISLEFAKLQINFVQTSLRFESKWFGWVGGDADNQQLDCGKVCEPTLV